MHTPPDIDLARLLEQANAQSIVIEKNGVRYRITREDADPWAGYDPEKVRAAIARSAGLFKGIDHEALIREVYEARGQDSHGRPAE